MTEPGDRFDRCAVQAGLRGDPMLGTAFPAARLLLVEQPGPWGRAGLLEGIRGIGVARFTDSDVVRHPLVAEIVRAYDARDRARSEARDVRVNAREAEETTVE